MPTIFLTGLPRSGTTLTCALLNEFSDTLALAEPIALQPHGDRLRAVHEIEEFVAAMHHQALTTGTAVSKHVDGEIPDNWVEPPSESGWLRKVLEQRGLIKLDKALTPNFYLVIKHPAEFSALADLLTRKHVLFAQVRNPLDVLATWQTVDMPVNRGHMPMAEAFNPELKMKLAAISDRVKRQVALLGWLFRVYQDFPPDRVIRYEDIIRNPRETLSHFTANARTPARELTLYDPATRYRGVDLSMLAIELLPIRALVERFYPDFNASLAPWLGQKT